MSTTLRTASETPEAGHRASGAPAAPQPHRGTERDSWLPPRVSGHRPLWWVTVATAVLAVAFAAFAIIDPVDIGGTNGWFKPLKFAISITIYTASMAWIIGLLGRGRRIVWWLGTIVAATMAIEIAVIAGAAAAGITSHFNTTNPIYSIMGVSVVIAWVATAAIGFVAFRARRPGDDPARTLALRAGVVVGLTGMALAFLMTSPTASQLADPQGIFGAHTVGAADGGPGLPFLGWSTEHGDLRIGHFVGMHALQALPLFALALEWAGRRVPRLRDARIRMRLVAVAAAAWSAVTALVTLQALAGESIVAPSTTTLLAASAIAVATLAAGWLAVARITRTRPHVSRVTVATRP